MPHCPHCQKPIDSHAIVCPHCRTTLKAFGHPGVPLHQARGAESLCDRCSYHADDSCNFPQRPHARTCTLFRDLDKPQRSPKGKNLRSRPSSAQPVALGTILVLIVAIALLLAVL